MVGVIVLQLVLLPGVALVVGETVNKTESVTRVDYNEIVYSATSPKNSPYSCEVAQLTPPSPNPHPLGVLS